MRFSKRYLVIIPAILLLIFFLLPVPFFDDPTSTVVEGENGALLGAKIADDGQWRFPLSKEVSEKFEKAILNFEDQYFYSHPGINPVAIGRALINNIKAGRVVSGGSTITMQTVRLSRKGKARTIREKLIESVLSFRLEVARSKKEILSLYSSNAPFGGNVVGLEAASWRYFGRSPNELSWAEASTLAVLPNAPSLVYPGKNSTRLKAKRDRLLYKLYQKGIIDSTTLVLSKLEDLPRKPYSLPQKATHVLTRALIEQKGKRIRTTLNEHLQRQVVKVVENHHKQLRFNEIHNAAAIVLEVETGKTLAYVGNTKNIGNADHGNDVDIIMAPRSTGSILKPFLYAGMINTGDLLPEMLVADIPIHLSGYSPKNFNQSFDGAVHANQALSRSLNVPAVRMLREYTPARFLQNLRDLGFTSFSKPADHYGLSLILGGGEANLWELTGVYAGLARRLIRFNETGKYVQNDIRPSVIFSKQGEHSGKVKLKEQHYGLSAASIWYTFKAMEEVNRPENSTGWKAFSSSKRIAWKTGTSFGFRDAWAIGITPQYVVGVWAGNANGEGRPGLTGVTAAAPILFDIMNALPIKGWFEEPLSELYPALICKKSGHRAGQWCNETDTLMIPVSGLNSVPCPYHQLVHLDPTETYRVNSSCCNPDEMKHKSWFVLPPAQEWYYKKRHPFYRELPPYFSGCNDHKMAASMEWIYPRNEHRLYVPRELDGSEGKIIFEVAHRHPEAQIYWHLDEQYLASTQNIHQLGITPPEGEHVLTLVDENGEQLVRRFTVVSKKR